MDKNLISGAELAELLGVSRGTVYNWTKSGLLTQFVRVGPKLIRYKIPEAIDELSGKI
jgi:excisionase family DNA binding protein